MTWNVTWIYGNLAHNRHSVNVYYLLPSHIFLSYLFSDMTSTNYIFLKPDFPEVFDHHIRFSLCLWISTVLLICLDIVCCCFIFPFIQLRVRWASWACDLLFISYFGTFSAILFKHWLLLACSLYHILELQLHVDINEKWIYCVRYALSAFHHFIPILFTICLSDLVSLFSCI